MITLDGVRWQEVFKGADKTIITNNINEKGTIEEIEEKFWSDDEKLRREKLLPFFWKTIEEQGQLYGNKERGSVMRLTNPYFFSYPGYNELLVGFSDDSLNSNEKTFNPNTNVLEYMNQQTGFKGQVAAFASWDVFDWIINKDRNDFIINSGAYPYEDSVLTQKQKWMNSFVSHMPYEGYGLGVRWDALTHEYAFDYLKYRKPRLLYIAYDETDEYGHEGKYDKYLIATHRLDKYVAELWTWTQKNYQYKNKTTILITTDHGRGHETIDAWRNHGSSVAGAENVWMAVLGPDTPPKGEVTDSEPMTSSQIAATIGAFLGFEYNNEKTVGPVMNSMFYDKKR